MEFTVTESMGSRFLEGVPKQSCVRNADDAATVLQECLSRRVDRVMLYSENLPDRFFDLSSGEAGVNPGKLRCCKLLRNRLGSGLLIGNPPLGHL